MSEWAVEKAAELMMLLLDTEVTLEVFERILAEELRIADATATERTFLQCRERRYA